MTDVRIEDNLEDALPQNAHDVVEEKSQNPLTLDEVAEEAVPEQIIGKKDARNKLNDMTGREWLFFQNSLWATRYKRSGKDAHAFDLRKFHPSPKPPELLAEIIRFFTKADGNVLDPFAGVGSTLLACALTGRNGVGMELNQHYIDIYRDICIRSNGQYRHMPLLQGDARHIAQNERVRFHSPYSLIIADPPYSDMLARPRTKKDAGAPTPFSLEEQDIGNLLMDPNAAPPYARFLQTLREILAAVCQLLSPGGHMIVFCKDFQPTPLHHNLLHADLVSELLQINRITYRGMRIWTNQTPKLYPFGYPFQFVANQTHQYMLIFQVNAE